MSDDPEYDVTEVEVSTSRRVQLEQYEPIEEQVTLTADVPEDQDPEAVANELDEVAWQLTEEGVMERYESHVREEAFGDDE